jgi:hypothetical protein
LSDEEDDEAAITEDSLFLLFLNVDLIGKARPVKFRVFPSPPRSPRPSPFLLDVSTRGCCGCNSCCCFADGVGVALAAFREWADGGNVGEAGEGTGEAEELLSFLLELLVKSFPNMFRLDGMLGNVEFFGAEVMGVIFAESGA